MTQLTHSTSTHPAAPEERKLADDLIGILGIVRRGWRFIAISVLVSMTIATLYVVRVKPVYKGATRLLVLQQGGRPLNEMVGGRGTYNLEEDDYIRTHILIIRSPLIVERAIACSGLTHLQGDDVLGRLTVTRPEPAVKILEIGYQAQTRDEATKIVTGVTDSYKKFLEENYQKNTNDVIALMTRVRDDLSKELKDLERKSLEFHREHKVFAVTEDGRSLITRQLDQYDQEANQSLLKEVKLKEQLRLAEEMVQEGEGLWAVSNALKVLGAGIEIDGGTDDASTLLNGSIEHLNQQLADTGLKRGMAEKLIEHLKAERAKTVATREVSEDEVVEAFYAEPDAGRLREQLSGARAKHDSAQRVVRSNNDPTVRAAQHRMQALQADLAALWQRRRPALRELLARDADVEVDAAIRRSNAEALVLRATESALRERLDQLQGAEDRAKGDAPGPNGPVASANPRLPRAAGPVQALLSSLKRGLIANEKLGREMRRRFEERLDTAQGTEIDRLTEANLQAELGRARAMYNSVVEQLKQARIVSDNTTVTAQSVNPLAVAAVPPRVSMILIAALVMGLGLGIGLAFVADQLDARIRTLPEIRRTLDIAVLGLIPQLVRDELDEVAHLGLISHDKPRSMIAESYKSVRTNLEFHRRSRRVQVLLVTSPHPGDGKSTSSSNLAISLAHAGRKVLLVDADLRRPTQHVLHTLSRNRGLTQVLRDLLPFPRVVQPTAVEHLDLLAAGPEVANPAELLTAPCFGEFLTAARQSYDMIIIDSSPLLAVTDPSIISAVVDGIVLVVRATTIRRHEAALTRELLQTLGTPILGVVINGVTREQTGYSYGYGYGYGSYGKNGLPRSQEPAAVPAPERTSGTAERNGTDGP